jgi:hypothetical protein
MGFFTPSCIALLFTGGYRCLTPAVFLKPVDEEEALLVDSV